MKESTLLTVGKVTGVHGLSGNIKVWSYDDPAEVFSVGQSIQLKAENRTGTWYQIQKTAPSSRGVLLTLAGVENRDQAQALVQLDILIDKKELPELEEDTYYWQDLMDLEVVDQNTGSMIGSVENIFSTGAHDVLVVKKGAQETMIPVIESIIISVNIEDNTIVIDLPEGL